MSEIAKCPVCAGRLMDLGKNVKFCGTVVEGNSGQQQKAQAYIKCSRCKKIIAFYFACSKDEN